MMKKFKVMNLLLIILLISNISCDKNDESNRLIGKWKQVEYDYTTYLEFKSNGTFEYSSPEEPEYIETGKYKVESDKLYQMFSDEDYWHIFRIDELNSISLVLYEMSSDGTYYDRPEIYQRVE